MGKYKKKPVIIEAFEFTGPFCGTNIPQWFSDAVSDCRVTLRGNWKTDYCEINTLEGVMRANKGDYIILGIKGEIYPCKPDIFEQTYEAVHE